ncbi:hypothetical protein D3C73_1252100 [compost metagenome]
MPERIGDRLLDNAEQMILHALHELNAGVHFKMNIHRHLDLELLDQFANALLQTLAVQIDRTQVQQKRSHLGLRHSGHFFDQRDLALGLVEILLQRPPYGRRRHGDGEQLLGDGVMQLPRQTLALLHDGRHPRLLRELGVVRGETLKRRDLVLPFAADDIKLLSEPAQLILAEGRHREGEVSFFPHE